MPQHAYCDRRQVPRDLKSSCCDRYEIQRPAKRLGGLHPNYNFWFRFSASRSHIEQDNDNKRFSVIPFSELLNHHRRSSLKHEDNHSVFMVLMNWRFRESILRPYFEHEEKHQVEVFTVLHNQLLKARFSSVHSDSTDGISLSEQHSVVAYFNLSPRSFKKF